MYYRTSTDYIKCFGNSCKDVSFMVKNDNVLDKHNKIWDQIKEKLKNKIS